MTKKSRIKKQLDKIVQKKSVPKNPKCYVCGKQTSEMHHYIQKSQSLFLRWHKKNLIPLCKSCHYKHHRLGDPYIVETIISKKGQKWVDWINKNRRKTLKDSITNLEEMLAKWDNK